MKRFQAPFYSQITKLVLPIVLQSLLSAAAMPGPMMRIFTSDS